MADREDDQGTNLRRYPRLSVEEKLAAVVTRPDGTKAEAVVRDISVGGAGLLVGGTFHNETFVDLHMEGIGSVNARVVRRFVAGLGIEFNLSEKEKAELQEKLIKFRRAGGRQKH